MQAQEFVRKWQAGGAANELNERAGAQAHFIDLCRVLGVPEPGDPKQYCFERGVAKTGCKKDLAKRTLTNLYNQRATWLASIARNSAIDSLRRRKAQPQTISTTVHDADDGDDRDLLHDFASNDPGPAQQVEQAAQARALRHCLGVLSGEQSQAVALAFYQGLSYTEVADHLRQPLGTVKSWVRRGLLALRGCLESREAGA